VEESAAQEGARSRRPRPAVANPTPKRREIATASCRRHRAARGLSSRGFVAGAGRSSSKVLIQSSSKVLIQKEASGKPSCARKTSLENRAESNLHAAAEERERAALADRGSVLEEDGQEMEDHTWRRAPRKRGRGAERSAAATPPEERG
jgi:hypothetical protein